MMKTIALPARAAASTHRPRTFRMPTVKLAFALWLSAACGAAAALGIEPIYIKPLLLSPPAGAGWKITSRDEFGLGFQRIDQVAKKQNTATAALIPVGISEDPANIEAELKGIMGRQLEKIFKVEHSDYQHGRSHGYLCATAQIDATQSVTMPEHQPTIAVPNTITARMCRKSGNSPIGFIAMYLSSSLNKAEQSKQDGINFVNGVSLQHR